jgi:hypothetical protein
MPSMTQGRRDAELSVQRRVVGNLRRRPRERITRGKSLGPQILGSRSKQHRRCDDWRLRATSMTCRKSDDEILKKTCARISCMTSHSHGAAERSVTSQSRTARFDHATSGLGTRFLEAGCGVSPNSRNLWLSSRLDSLEKRERNGQLSCWRCIWIWSNLPGKLRVR